MPQRENTGITLLFRHKHTDLSSPRQQQRLLIWLLLLAFSILRLSLLPNAYYQLHAGTLIYTIEEGDTLESIAQRFKVSLASLVRLNRFQNLEQAKSKIIRGESILIPAPDIELASVRSTGIEPLSSPPPSEPELKLTQTSPVALPQAQLEQSPAMQTATDAPPPTRSPASKSYTVQAGDTISGLATRFGSPSARIRQANRLNGDNIRIGQLLVIPTETEELGNITVAMEIEEPVSDPSLALNLQATTSRQSDPSLALNLQATTSRQQESNSPESTYTVKKGDTLIGISRKTGVSIGVIRTLNQLEDDYIRPDQVLRISSFDQAVQTQRNTESSFKNSEPDPSTTQVQEYQVAKGDTLSSISLQFHISLSQILEWNQLNDPDILRIGQKLRLETSAQPQTTTNTAQNEYRIESGDTLWGISQRFGLSVKQIRLFNPELGEVLQPGQTLQLAASSSTGPSSTAAAPLADAVPGAYISKKQEDIQTQSEAEDTAFQRLETRKRQNIRLEPPASLPQTAESQNRPTALHNYFVNNPPRLQRQPNASYFEEFTDDPLENYQAARQLLTKFDKEIETMPKLSDDLKDYWIMIDPGHGGLDPGFNSQSEDGSGHPLYIIEDEYNYDYALRLYRQLKRHGTHVGLTILSPNHLIIDSPDASRTLISQKNEVYNSPFINQRGEYSSWPIGTPSGLHKRVETAESFFNGTPKDKRIFISLHNDNSPWDGDGRLILYYNDTLTIDSLGESFAKSLVPYLGKNAHMRGQNLAVLRKNPASYAVLVELRNIAHPRNSWAIRNPDLRQEDTEMLTEGILRFVQSLK